LPHPDSLHTNVNSPEKENSMKILKNVTNLKNDPMIIYAK
jgi:hypothetical protein